MWPQPATRIRSGEGMQVEASVTHQAPKHRKQTLWVVPEIYVPVLTFLLLHRSLTPDRNWFSLLSPISMCHRRAEINVFSPAGPAQPRSHASSYSPSCDSTVRETRVSRGVGGSNCRAGPREQAD